MKNDSFLRKRFLFLKSELFDKRLKDALLFERNSLAKLNSINQKKTYDEVAKAYEHLHSLSDKLFSSLYDSDEEFVNVLENGDSLLNGYTLPGRTCMGNYIELCFYAYGFLLILKVMFFSGISKEAYHQMKKKTDVALQYLEELFEKADSFGIDMTSDNEAIGDMGAIEFVKPALYLTNELHKLYIAAALAEHQVYKGFGKRKKAQKAIDMFDKIMSRTIDPYSQITQSSAGTKAQGKDFAEAVVQLYKLFISLNESRIAVLREFKQHGMSPMTHALNEKSLSICGDYDKLCPLIKQQAEQLYDMFSSMDLFQEYGIDM